MAAGRILQGVISLGSVAILARLLSPSDYGVLAMVLPVALIASMTMNAGLHVAIMHEEQLNVQQASRLFWTAQRFNLFLLGAMALTAPLLALFYREPRVTTVALLWTAAILFQALGAFPGALLKRQMRFGLITAVDVGSLMVGVITAILVASTRFKSFALIAQVLVWSAVRCLGALAVSGWIPTRPAASETDPVVVRLVRFGGQFGLTRAVYWLGRQFDRMVVGYLSGASALGLYDSARRWSWYPFQELFLALTDVAVASLSRARQDAARFREYARRGITAFLALPLPAVAFVGLDAEGVVRVLLGERWLGAVPMVRIMSAAAFVDSVGRLTTWLNTAEGHTRRQLTWTIVSTCVTVALVLVTAPRGPVAVTWGFAGATVGLAIPGVAFCLRGSALSWRDYLEAIWRPIVASLIAVAVFAPVRGQLPALASSIVQLAVDLSVFGVLYVLSWFFLPGGRRATRELIELVRAVVSGASRPPSDAAALRAPDD